MDKLKKEQDAIDRAQAALDERQARIRLLEELTTDQKEAITELFREEDDGDVVASTTLAKKTEQCPGCGRDFLRSGVKRHIRATHPDDADRLQEIVDQHRSD